MCISAKIAQVQSISYAFKKRPTVSVLLMSQIWNKLQTSGEKPPGRCYHSACCITGANPALMVVGGFGGTGDGGVLSDVWLLDVTDGSWSEVLHAHVQ